MIDLRLIIFFLFIYWISGYGCFVMENSYSKIPPGPWRATLKLDPDQVLIDQVSREISARENLRFDEVTEGELPFNMLVTYSSKDSFFVEIWNAEERTRIDDIAFKHDRATNKDTVILKLPLHDSYIKAIFEDKILEGTWYAPKHGPDYQVNFVAHHGQNHRFTTLKKNPVMDLSGTWSATFAIETDDPYSAVGKFKQKGNHIIGAFFTENGDYRHLEGTVQADKLYLSTFNGAHAFLFEAKINPDSTLSGIFRSGLQYQTSWIASLDNTLRSTNPDSLTFPNDPLK